MAAGITSYDGSSDITEDPEVGVIKFYIKYWNHPEFGDEFGFHELKSSMCDPEKDFNYMAGSNADSGFYPVLENSEADLRTYGHKLKCIREPYNIFGDFNTYGTASLMVIFEKCDPSVRTCKSEQEIEEWMKFKYIFTLENEKKFQTHVFDDEERVLQAAHTNWYSLTHQFRMEYVKTV